jgi:hypothetical protein
MEFKHDDENNLERCDVRPEECATEPPIATSDLPVSIDDDGIRELIEFFTILDEWDREAQSHEEL